MSRSHWMCAAAVLAATPLAAQNRSVNLTGRPAASLEEPFTQISGVRELPGNKVVVIDAGEKTVQMADLASGKLTKVGRNGGGPGEYQLPVALFAAPGNATWISDPQLGKVHVMSPDGKITSTLLTPGGDGPGGLVFPRAVDASGRLYFQSFGFTPGSGVQGPPDTVAVVRWDPKAKRVDTLGYVPSGMVSTARGNGSSTNLTIRRPVYAKADAWTALPDGRLAIVRAEPYRVDIVDGPGRVRKGTPVAYTPIKIGAAERDAYRKSLKSGAQGATVVRSFSTGGGGGGSAPAVSAPRSMPASIADIKDEDFPAVMPAFNGGGIRVTPEGEIWVLRYRAANDHVPTYDIFDSNGRLVGKATLKDNSTVVGFGQGTVYIARQDPEDDFRYLEKYARPGAEKSGALPLGQKGR